MRLLGHKSGGAGRGEALDWVRVGAGGAGNGDTTCGEGVLELFSSVVPVKQDIKQHSSAVITDRMSACNELNLGCTFKLQAAAASSIPLLKIS